MLGEMGLEGMSAGFRFNSDLLRSEPDRNSAQAAYPDIAFALDHPELRALFEPIDDAANAAKKLGRRRGIEAVCMVAVALLITAWMPLSEHEPLWLRQALAATGAALGLIGGYLGLSGVLFGEAKHAWLRNRFATERLRQLHFQSLVALAPLVMKAAESGDRTPFLKARAAALARFDSEQLAHLDAKLAGVLNRDVGEEPWLLDVAFDPAAAQGAHLNGFLDALAHLRIDHQIDFAEYMLSSDAKLFSKLPFQQIKIIDGAALGCVLMLLVLDVLVLIGVAAGAAPLLLVLAHCGAISFAIVALALRTLEEGLQPHREVERYRQYSASLRLIRARFRGANSSAEKLTALKELEDLSYAEMVSFLNSNHEAKFIM